MSHYVSRIWGLLPRGSSRATRINLVFLTSSLLVVNVLFVADGAGAGSIFQFAGPTVLPAPFDDILTGAAGPYPAIPVSSITYAAPYSYLNGQCVWINSALNNYIRANPTIGVDPSGQLWRYQWAPLATEKLVQSGITVVDYHPFVGSQAQVNLPNNLIFPAVAQAEVGGAVITLNYTPNLNGNNAPVLNNPVWIQAYEGTRRGVGFGPILDNANSVAYQSQSNSATPYYGGAMGTVNGTNPTQAWFADEPAVYENEYENNPVVSAQFQVVLATDRTSRVRVGGTIKTLNNLTLYGGEWWGFTYSAVDKPPPVAAAPFAPFPQAVPEPSTLLLTGLGAIGLAIARYRRRGSPRGSA